MLSVFSRILVTFAGFLIFVVTTHTFGATGRGLIAYATSIFGIIAHLISFNISKGYLIRNKSQPCKTGETLSSSLAWILIATSIGFLLSYIFWFFNKTLNSSFALTSFLIFSTSIFYHIWNGNGTTFFAAHRLASKHNIIMIINRTAQILFTFFFWLLATRPAGIRFEYGVIFLTLLYISSPLMEFLYLAKTRNLSTSQVKLDTISLLVKKSITPHLDTLAIHIAPLLITVVSARELNLEKLAAFNLFIQALGLPYMLATISGTRVIEEASARESFSFSTLNKFIIRKTVLYGIAGLVLIAPLTLLFYLDLFKVLDKSLTNLVSPFTITTFSFLGLLLYHNYNPVSILTAQTHKSAVLNGIILLTTITVTPTITNKYGLIGASTMYTSFYLAIGAVQCILSRKALIK